jgi:hypothetical protein
MSCGFLINVVKTEELHAQLLFGQLLYVVELSAANADNIFKSNRVLSLLRQSDQWFALEADIRTVMNEEIAFEQANGKDMAKSNIQLSQYDVAFAAIPNCPESSVCLSLKDKVIQT